MKRNGDKMVINKKTVPSFTVDQLRYLNETFPEMRGMELSHDALVYNKAQRDVILFLMEKMKVHLDIQTYEAHRL